MSAVPLRLETLPRVNPLTDAGLMLRIIRPHTVSLAPIDTVAAASGRPTTITE